MITRTFSEPTDTQEEASDSFSGVTLSAFCDELEKIAEAASRPKKGEQFKKFIKTTATIAAGTAAGTGALMVGEKILNAVVGDSWRGLSPQTRSTLLGVGSSAAALGAAYMAKRLLDEKKKQEA
jgi:hypothetical protein